ncbi:right-handed parallel beta-helix repeat-containing protein [Hymenobacter sp. YC55]|uniref:right-handed parallel beta-helix repeat-containing protein n=1 Tax=Hymenobacter sp. YC55 TaxID=3034019 RepID=UPI0023F830AD|nr:right-handed parallel beta-helix repeat-containing protein [Hymenobacter sp. YC55]
MNSTPFKAGDQILFEGGSNFEGAIWVRSTVQGSVARPILFGSYGAGRARIISGTTYGFYAENIGGIELHNLEFVGSGRLTNTNSGVIFHLDLADTHLQHVVLDNLSVQGYRDRGISIGSANGSSGYDHVRVTRCVVSANGEAGLGSYAQTLAAHHNWYVGSCQAFDNTGRADVTDTHTGSGIVLSGVDGVLIERCEAHHNGALNANPNGGPVGIWGWNCNNLIIQYCESHHNQTGTTKDGGGFDLDGGCTNSILQYNYSHDNDGPGYLVAQYANAPPLHDVTVRYNISENDGRRHGQGALTLWSSGANGGIQRAFVHNNTIYVSAPADNSQPKAVHISGEGFTDVGLHNNVLQTTAGLPVVVSLTTRGVLLQGNAYWSSGQALQIAWGAERYNSLREWRAATGQEQLGTRATGIEADPQLQQPGTGGTLATLNSSRQLTSLTAYQMQASSGLLGTGLDLLSEFNRDPGPHDFFGNPIPSHGEKRAIGASESTSN